MSVDTQHQQFKDTCAGRDLYLSVVGGTDGVQKGQTKYLPQYPAESSEEYQKRLKAATIDGVVLTGRDGLVGKVFAEPIDVSGVNPSIVPLFENVDLEGNNFDIFSKRAFTESFAGWSVILVDAPKVSQPVQSAEDQTRFGLRPYLKYYIASNVINWRWVVDPLTKQTRLALLVLKEPIEVPDGEFGSKTVERFRVYRHIDATVTVEVWEKGQNAAQAAIVEPAQALAVTGIPVGIIGKLGDPPWLLNESRLEVKAYQKESSFDIIEYLSIPLPVFKGRPVEMIGKPMPYGPSVCADISTDGDAFYMQIDTAGLAQLKQTFDSIKQTIAGMLDAITKEAMPAVNDDQTATEVVSDDKKSQARLIVWADQCKDALERAIQYMGQFMGLGDDAGGEIVLRTAWVVAQEKSQLMEEQRQIREQAEVTAIGKKANG